MLFQVKKLQKHLRSKLEVEKNLLVQLSLGLSVSNLAEVAFFSSTANFDLLYICSLLIYQSRSDEHWIMYRRLITFWKKILKYFHLLLSLNFTDLKKYP